MSFEMQSSSSYSYKTTTNYGYTNQPVSSPSPAVLVNSGLTDRDGAKQVAKRILSKNLSAKKKNKKLTAHLKNNHMTQVDYFQRKLDDIRQGKVTMEYKLRFYVAR